MSRSRIGFVRFVAWMLPGLFCAVASAQAPTPARNGVLLTGFAVNQPAQMQDIDDMAHGFPRELARRLQARQAWPVRTSPDLLSWDWRQGAPSAGLLSQTATLYDSRFIVSGEIRNAGVYIQKRFFGLWETKKRSVEVEIHVYDARSGGLLARHDFARTVDGDVYIGREQVFGGAGFVATPFGAGIAQLLDEAALAIVADLQGHN